MIRVIKASVAVILTVFLFSGTAVADDQFGLGIMLGEPTGINGKYFIEKLRLHFKFVQQSSSR